MLGEIGRQNIAEVAGWNHDVDRVAEGDFPLIQQLAVCGKIVGNLRGETSPVD